MKRILAFVITLLLLCSMVAMPATAAEEVSYPDFQFAVTLGFIDGENMYPDEAITRAQLAQVFHNIVFYNNQAESPMVHNSNESDYAFSDVKEEQKDAVKLVYDMGIMTGFPDGTFRPDATVTYHQLIKAMVSFLGYDEPAKELGGWTAGYLTQANRLGILPGGNIAGDAVATCGAVGQMLKLATNADVMLTTNGVARVLKGVNYLKHWCQILITNGQVTGNYLTNTSTDMDVSYFGIYLNDAYMAVAKSAAGVQDKLGYSITVYYREIGGTNTILCYEDAENNYVLDIDAEELISATTQEMIYTKNEGETTQTCRVVSNATVIYNGSHLESYNADDLSPFKTVGKDGAVRLVDNNVDGVYDIVIVDVYDIYVVKTVRDGIIYNYYKPKETVDISDYEERNINIINVLGEPILPQEIKEGQVISVCRDKSGAIKRIMATKDALSGSVQMIRKNGDTITGITVNGTEFKMMSQAMIIDSSNRLEPGTQVSLYFGHKGKIAYLDVDGGFFDGYQAGMMIDITVEGNFTEIVKAHIFGADEQIHVIEFPKKIELNGSSFNCSEKALRSAFGVGEKNKIIRQPFLYKTNDAGDKFTAIQIAKKIDAAAPKYEDGLYLYPKGDGTQDDTYEYSFNGGLRCFDNSFATSANTVVFAIPSDEERYEFESYSIASLPSGEIEKVKADAYGTKKEGMIADIVVINATKTASSSDQYRPIFIVSDVMYSRDKDNMPTVQISGLYVERKNYYEGSFNTDKALLMETMGRIPEKGDILRLPSFKNTGEIKKFSGFIDLFKFDGKVFHQGGEIPYVSSSHYYRYGKVMEFDDGVIKIQHHNATKDTAVFRLISEFDIIEVKTKEDGSIASIKKADASCILAENDCPGYGSDVFVYNYYTSGIAVFVFN